MPPKEPACIDHLKNSFHGASGSFPTTHWSLIYETPSDPKALAKLVTQYEPALNSFLTRCLRIPQDKAEEILQEFLLHKLVERNIIQEAKVARGRFRRFLRTALHNFARNWFRDHARTPVPLEIEPPARGSADPFDIEWALQVIDKSIKAMQEGCEADGRADLWGIFENRVLLPSLQGAEPVSYRVLTERYRFESPAATQNALVTAKRRFAKALEMVVASYEYEAAEINEEISSLFEILKSSRARCD